MRIAVPAIEPMFTDQAIRVTPRPAMRTDMM
jgi:hypothetical protein